MFVMAIWQIIPEHFIFSGRKTVAPSGAKSSMNSAIAVKIIHSLEEISAAEWNALAGDDPSWLRLKATADEVDLFSPDYLEAERRSLGEAAFKREYLGIPASDQASPFGWELYERATEVRPPLVGPGPHFQPPPEAPGVLMPNPFQKLKPMGVAS